MSRSYLGNCTTVWESWKRNAENMPDKDAIIHWVSGEEPFRWSYSALIQAAESFSISLKESGIKQGDVCAIIIKHNSDFYPLYLAVSRLGAIPAVLAYPNPRLHPDKFRQGIEGMSHRSGLDYILTERSSEQILKPLIECEGSTIKAMFFPLEWERERIYDDIQRAEINKLHSSATGSEAFLLQHSSGTTGLQKPVLLSHTAVLKHIFNYAQAIELSEKDKIISWLPLYHDMGLIAAFHLPLISGIPVVQIDPFEWVLAPSILMEAISKEKGTLTWLPNFAFNILADKIFDDDLEGCTLESMRMIINCSEPIREESVTRFDKRFSPFGLKKNVISSSYAMAEATFAVTQTPPSVSPTVIYADRVELAKGRFRPAVEGNNVRSCVASGKILNNCNIKIIDNSGVEVGEDIVGELIVTSESLFDGYRNYPEKTAEVLKNGWYFSGDYAFRHDGDYFIIGRKKDIIIVAGNNIYPEDVEDAVSQVKGIIPGRVVAFGEEDASLGSEQISIVAETSITEEAELKQLRMELIKACMQIDITVRKIYLVPPRWLIKSSAGKPSRKANMERIIEKKLVS